MLLICLWLCFCWVSGGDDPAPDPASTPTHSVSVLPPYKPSQSFADRVRALLSDAFDEITPSAPHIDPLLAVFGPVVSEQQLLDIVRASLVDAMCVESPQVAPPTTRWPHIEDEVFSLHPRDEPAYFDAMRARVAAGVATQVESASRVHAAVCACVFVWAGVLGWAVAGRVGLAVCVAVRRRALGS